MSSLIHDTLKNLSSEDLNQRYAKSYMLYKGDLLWCVGFSIDPITAKTIIHYFPELTDKDGEPQRLENDALRELHRLMIMRPQEVEQFIVNAAPPPPQAAMKPAGPGMVSEVFNALNVNVFRPPSGYYYYEKGKAGLLNYYARKQFSRGFQNTGNISFSMPNGRLYDPYFRKALKAACFGPPPTKRVVMDLREPLNKLNDYYVSSFVLDRFWQIYKSKSNRSGKDAMPIQHHGQVIGEIVLNTLDKNVQVVRCENPHYRQEFSEYFPKAKIEMVTSRPRQFPAKTVFRDEDPEMDEHDPPQDEFPDDLN